MDALTVAKEITLALLPILPASSMRDPEKAGEAAGKVFNTVLKEVNRAIKEVSR